MNPWPQMAESRDLIHRITEQLHRLDLPPLSFMEVCGTHTMAIARYSIRTLMPKAITLTSGPGCPVCVTATGDIDSFIAASKVPGAIITTFGDLIRVPGSKSSLQEEMGRGADVRVVYSPLDALAIARSHPDHQVIFLGVGFETTTPTVAATMIAARGEEIGNFSVLSSHKVMMPALTALLGDPELRIDGLICPGHVSVVIGADAYQPLVRQYSTPCVVAGFEPLDILQAVLLLALQIVEKNPRVEVAYQRAVTESGNSRARAVMEEVFAPDDAPWRGLGVIPASGLAIREAYQSFDARCRFDLPKIQAEEPAGCRCGEVLKGIMPPSGCRLFGSACHPGRPVGPCMVSSEGACAAFHRYGTPVTA
ncbi:MAG: hydrogenase formation protein HypD [Desulfobulbaceae bacterium]|nr:hydrogenase formation protein HypD [Desulfobulbaceae bacterium]